jgi:hypothetical protein
MSYTHRDFFGFVPPPSLGRTHASTDKKCYDYIERGHHASQCLNPHLHPIITLNYHGNSTPTRVKQDYVRGLVNHVTPRVLRRHDIYFGWKLVTLEEMCPKGNMP